MIKGRDFLKDLKNETLQKAPPNFTNAVIQKSGILVINNQLELSKDNPRCEKFYKFGSIAIGISLVVLFLTNVISTSQVPRDRPGKNVVILVNHVSHALKTVVYSPQKYSS